MYYTNRHSAKLSYDPDDVNIRLQHFRVSQLIGMVESYMIENKDFEFLSDYIDSRYSSNGDIIYPYGDDGLQRHGNLWNDIQKSQFIESLMIKLPIPLFYFDGSDKPWRIIDGLQRLSTLISFVKGQFRLKGLEYLIDECEGLGFLNIPGFLRNRILDAEIIAYVINPGTPPDVKFNIFKRINTGGLKLNGQEIRNAFFRGPSAFLRRLAEHPAFLRVTNHKLNRRRMIDREYVNRFIAFQIFGFESYNGKMDLFLSDALLQLSSITESELNALETKFLMTMDRCYELFGDKAFFRPRPGGNTGRILNKALFDTVSWNISMLNDKDFERILMNREHFLNQYESFMNQTLMYQSINDTTGAKMAVWTRFKEFDEFLFYFYK